MPHSVRGKSFARRFWAQQKEEEMAVATIGSAIAQPTHQFEEITPDLARRYLESNLHNRNLSKNRVKQFARDMDEGRWQSYSPQGISCDYEGRLIDGQHRLAAIVESGCSIVMLVIKGLPPQMQDVLDIGANRYMSQILALHDIREPNAVGALASAWIRYRHSPDRVWTGNEYPTKAEMLGLVQDRGDLLSDAVRVGSEGKRATMAPRTPYGLLFILASEAGLIDEWIPFHEKILTGAGLSEGDPRLALRGYYIRNPRAHGAWGIQQRVAITIKAFNAYRAGRDLRVLRFARDEMPMPVIS